MRIARNLLSSPQKVIHFTNHDFWGQTELNLRQPGSHQPSGSRVPFTHIIHLVCLSARLVPLSPGTLNVLVVAGKRACRCNIPGRRWGSRAGQELARGGRGGPSGRRANQGRNHCLGGGHAKKGTEQESV